MPLAKTIKKKLRSDYKWALATSPLEQDKIDAARQSHLVQCYDTF